VWKDIVALDHSLDAPVSKRPRQRPYEWAEERLPPLEDYNVRRELSDCPKRLQPGQRSERCQYRERARIESKATGIDLGSAGEEQARIQLAKGNYLDRVATRGKLSPQPVSVMSYAAAQRIGWAD
jgi:hypothetical protein